MVDRAVELEELVRAWTLVTLARRRGVHPVVITGAAGVGKSRLLAAALSRFAPTPRIILSGTARVHAPVPYDWLASALSGHRTEHLPVPPAALAWLGQHPEVPTERYAPGALLRLAVRTVRALVGDGPAVLVVEDLHALDPASLNLVGELATVADLPALLLVASRPPEEAVARALVTRTLARLAGVPGAVRQHLRPLDAEGVAAILAQVYPVGVTTDVVQSVWARTGGNPSSLLELIVRTGRGRPDRLVWDSPPAEELTARETEVLTLLAEGMSNKQVAKTLGISVRTVAVHVSSLLRKTGSASRTEAALWAVQRRSGQAGRGR